MQLQERLARRREERTKRKAQEELERNAEENKKPKESEQEESIPPKAASAGRVVEKTEKLKGRTSNLPVCFLGIIIARFVEALFCNRTQTEMLELQQGLSITSLLQVVKSLDGSY